MVKAHGPNAGNIVAVVDWEMASTVPAWSLLCCPDWFANEAPWCSWDPDIAAQFKNIYVQELCDIENMDEVLNIVEKDEWRRKFAELALQPWLAAHLVEQWLEDE